MSQANANVHDEIGSPDCHTRRRFLCGLAAAASTPLLVSPVFALPATNEQRALKFQHTHTGEKLSVTYFAEGQYLAEAMDKINHHLRDHRTGDVTGMDPALLDLLHQVSTVTGSSSPFQVISGYRSPATNKLLRKNGGGVAKKSLHMQGRAIDVRLADIDTAQLRRAALDLRAGGVGYYRRSNFIHLDTGRFRTW